MAPRASSSRLPAPTFGPSSTAPGRQLRSATAAPAPSRKGKERADPPPLQPSAPSKPPKRKIARPSGAKRRSDPDDEDEPSLDDADYDGAGEEEEEDQDESGGEGDDAKGAALGLGPPSPSDWSDPRNLPQNQNGQPRRKARLKRLQVGVYASAMLDVVDAEMDLGRTLFELEEMRKEVAREEDAVRALRGDQVYKAPGTRQYTSSRRDKSGSEAASGTEMDSNEEEDDDDDAESDSRSRPTTTPSDFGDPNLPAYPYPSSNWLSDITRWPVPLPSDPSREAPRLRTSLETLFTSTSRRLFPLRPRPRRKRPRTRSAYGPSAPLEPPPRRPKSTLPPPPPRRRSSPTSSSSSSSSSDDDDDVDVVPKPALPLSPSPPLSSPSSSSSSDSDSDALDSSLDDPALPAHAVSRIAKTLNSILDQLALAIPLGPFPPRDLWECKHRDVLEANERGKGKGVGEAVGWESVLSVVRDAKDISPNIANLLSERLEALYGPPRTTFLAPHPPSTPSTPKPKATLKSRLRTTSSSIGADDDESSAAGLSTSTKSRKRPAVDDDLSSTGGGGRKKRKPRSSSIPLPNDSLSPSFLSPNPSNYAADDPGPPPPEPTYFDPVLEHLGGLETEGAGFDFDLGEIDFAAMGLPPLPPLPGEGGFVEN